MTFHFLHISDIHLDDELTSQKEFRKQILKIINNKRIKADCLIISGDLFNRGALDESNTRTYSDFFNHLPGKDHILAVPGNHDLDRSAQQSIAGSYNKYITRKDIVLRLGNTIATDGAEFKLTNNERYILYEMAFRAFYSFAQKMKFQNFLLPDITLSAECYEVQIVEIPFTDQDTYKVRFVLLNTALTAGQSVRGNDYRERLKKLEDIYQEKVIAHNPIDAAKINVEIAKLKKSFEDYGELVIDEETEGESGRMSLSNNGNNVLSSIQDKRSEGVVLTVFVGHHGYQYLSKETQTALKSAMITCGSGIYLCGHAHQARFRRFPFRNNSYPRDVEQIQAGVLFKDETGFSQYGFNSASFDLDIENGKLQGVISSYSLIKSASQEFRWMKEDIPFELTLPNMSSSNEEPAWKDSQSKEEKRVQKAKKNTCDPSNIENMFHDALSESSSKYPTKQGPASTHDVRLSVMKKVK